MMVLAGGRERTKAEFDALFERTGFGPSRVIELEGARSDLIEVRPA